MSRDLDIPKDIFSFLAFCFQAIKKQTKKTKSECFTELRKPQSLGIRELPH